MKTEDTPSEVPVVQPKMSSQEKITSLHQTYHTPNYAPGLVLTKGKGATVWDVEGNKYLDFVSGIAVTALGHCHPAITGAIRKQAGRLMHVSNLYYNDQAPYLAETLSKLSLGGKVIFSNSGAEANEGLIKLARLWGSSQGRHEIITMNNSFHGRTLATLTATGQEKVQKGFEPLPEGFVHVPYNDMAAVRNAVTDKTVAIMLEPIQAEGGVLPALESFIKGIADLCKEKDLLLLMDEIQTGIGRTGEWFGYQHYDVQPDAISLAKGLGGGFPIGAVVTGDRLKDVFTPGTHGSTFAGQPMACAAGRAVVDTIANQNLVEHAQSMGALLKDKLEKMAQKYESIQTVRGEGLLIGIVMRNPAKDLEQLLMRKGLLTVATAGNVIRLLPPLTVSTVQIKKAVKLIDKACAEWQEGLQTQFEGDSE